MKLKPVFSVAYIVFILSVLIALFLGLAMADIEKVLQHPVRYEIVYEDTDTGAIEKSDVYVWWNVTLDRIANAWGTANSKVDLNRDGTVDFKDYMIWVNHTGLYEDSVTYRVVGIEGNSSITMQQGGTKKLYLRLVRQTDLLSTRQIYSNIISSNPLVGTFSSPSIIIQNRIEVGDSVEITDKGVSLYGETMSFLNTGNVAEFDYTANGVGVATLNHTRGEPTTITQNGLSTSSQQTTELAPHRYGTKTYTFEFLPRGYVSGQIFFFTDSGPLASYPIRVSFSDTGEIRVLDGNRGFVAGVEAYYTPYYPHLLRVTINMSTQTYSVSAHLPDFGSGGSYIGYRERVVPILENAEFRGQPVHEVKGFGFFSSEGVFEVNDFMY